MNDIYDQSYSYPSKKIGKGLDDVHYQDLGYDKLSEPVTEFLKKEIESLN